MPVVRTLSGKTIVVDLETRDFEGFRYDVLKSGGLADAYLPAWSDRSALDMGVALTEVFAFMAENLGYYQERCANECLWGAATQRRSIIEQAKLIGYSLRPPTSAQVELTIVTTGPGTLARNHQVTVQDSGSSATITFELESEFTAPGAGEYPGVIAIHGLTAQDPIHSSTGGPDQRFSLSRRGLSLSPSGNLALEVYVYEDGMETAWSLADTFVGTGPDSKVYRVSIDEDDIATIIFGDGVSGKIPSAGVNNLRFIYRTGGGHEGNEVGPNKLTQFAGAPNFISAVFNPKRPTGGLDKESIEEAREAAPRSLKAMDRAVSDDDYVTQALRVPGVRDAYSYRGNGAYEQVLVVASAGHNPVPTGHWDEYTETGIGMLGAVGAFIGPRKMSSVILKVRPCVLVEVYLAVRAHLKSGVIRDVALRNISDSLLTALDASAFRLGQQAPLSRVYEIVEAIEGVDYVDVLRFQRKPVPRHVGTSLYSPSDVTLEDIIVGEKTVDEVYTVQFTSGTEFVVTGENTGAQSGIGQVGVPYTTGGGEVTFTANFSLVAPTSADRLELKTGAFCGNIDPERDVVCALNAEDFALSLIGGSGTV